MRFNYTGWDKWTLVASVGTLLIAIAFGLEGDLPAALGFGSVALYAMSQPALSKRSWNSAYVVGHAAALEHLAEAMCKRSMISEHELSMWALREIQETAIEYQRASE